MNQRKTYGMIGDIVTLMILNIFSWLAEMSFNTLKDVPSRTKIS